MSIDSKSIRLGDLVTVGDSINSSAANVYLVARKLEGESFLQHPLTPYCYLLRRDEELNKASPILKSPLDKMLDFASKNIEIFDLNDSAELKALFLYYVIHRRLSQRQGRALASACGRIASEVLKSNIYAAIRLVVENKGLLDEYNLYWFENFKAIYAREKTPTPRQRESIFNQAGFVLAQLETVSIKKSGGGPHEHADQIQKT